MVSPTELITKIEESIKEGEEMKKYIMSIPIKDDYDNMRLLQLEKTLTLMHDLKVSLRTVNNNTPSFESYRVVTEQRDAMTQEVLELSQENSELKAKITQLEASSPSEVPSKKDVAFRLFVFLLVTFGSVAAQAAYAKSVNVSMFFPHISSVGVIILMLGLLLINEPSRRRWLYELLSKISLP
ncbi:hypothetical protein V8C86DRAFT_2879117 [Haematococcus lacustris]